MRSNYLLLTVLLTVFALASGAVFNRQRRQTYKYDDELRSYAHPHPGTKVSQGYLARYEPQDWPKWYSRNIMQWDAISRMVPESAPQRWGYGK